jgi:NAD(P)H dehydrogenase (quinone)
VGVTRVHGVKVLLVHSHPLEESYSAALRQRAVTSLVDAGHDVTVTALGRGDDPGPGADQLTDVETLVLVHPTWWGGQPAPLLDWIQREIGPWIDRPDDQPAPSPLGRVRHLAVVTSHGSSRLVNRLQGEPGRKLLERSVLPLCAAGAHFHWLALYKLDQKDRVELEQFVERVGAALAGITT